MSAWDYSYYWWSRFFRVQDHGRLTVVHKSKHSRWNSQDHGRLPAVHISKHSRWNSRDHGRLTGEHKSEHSLFRLKSTVGCLTSTYLSIYFFVGLNSWDHGRLLVAHVSKHSLFSWCWNSQLCCVFCVCCVCVVCVVCVRVVCACCVCCGGVRACCGGGCGCGCVWKTLPCVGSNAPLCTFKTPVSHWTWAFWRYTRERLERAHGSVLKVVAPSLSLSSRVSLLSCVSFSLPLSGHLSFSSNSITDLNIKRQWSLVQLALSVHTAQSCRGPECVGLGPFPVRWTC